MEKPKFPNLTLPQKMSRSLQVIIYIYNDGQEYPMLHTKFRENRPAGSGEEDF